MRYASFFILHLKAFFSRSFLSISLDAMWAREHFQFSAKERWTRYATVCIFNFPYCLLLLHTRSLHTHTQTHSIKNKRLNGEKIVLFLPLSCFRYSVVLKLQIFDQNTWKLMAWDSLAFRYVWLCIHRYSCFSFTCLYPMIGRQWFADLLKVAQTLKQCWK